LKWRSFTRVEDGRNIEFMLAFENVYGRLSEPAKQAITALWKAEDALTDQEQMEERLKQVVIIIRDSASGVVAGVSTAQKKRMQALNNRHLYEFRCFIGANHRIAGLDVKLSRETFDFLEKLSKSDQHHPVGIFSILENETLKNEPVWRRAVWPEIEMYFVGYTNSGNPIRVHYFKGARI
jgi:hypothetical protein